MNGNRPLTALVALMVVVASPAALAAAASGNSPTAYSLDTGIAINSEKAVQTYERTEKVSRNVTELDMEITIATELDMVSDTFGPAVGARNDFVAITYSEEIPRTVKIPISADYFHPFPRETLRSVNGKYTAKLTPVKEDGERFTMITLRFEEPGTAVLPIPEDAVAVYSAMNTVENRTNSTIGLNVSLTPTPWETIKPTAFAGSDTSVKIKGNPDKLMVQYNAGTAQNPTWLTVPSNPSDSVPVYRMTKPGVPNATYVVSTTSDPPALRYKKKASIGDKIAAATNGAVHIPERVLKLFGVDVPEVDVPFVGSVSAPISVSTLPSNGGVPAW